MKMRNLLILFSILILSSCSNYDFKISELNHEKLKFSELPVPVMEFLMQEHEFNNVNPSSLVVINSEKPDRYVLEVVNTQFGPWVDYMKLIDTSKKVSYKINQGVPSPFFVYENKLYIPNRYNIVVVKKNIEEVEFTCYTLK